MGAIKFLIVKESTYEKTEATNLWSNTRTGGTMSHWDFYVEMSKMSSLHEGEKNYELF